MRRWVKLCPLCLNLHFQAATLPLDQKLSWCLQSVTNECGRAELPLPQGSHPLLSAACCSQPELPSPEPHWLTSCCSGGRSHQRRCITLSPVRFILGSTLPCDPCFVSFSFSTCCLWSHTCLVLIPLQCLLMWVSAYFSIKIPGLLPIPFIDAWLLLGRLKILWPGCGAPCPSLGLELPGLEPLPTALASGNAHSHLTQWGRGRATPSNLLTN